MNKQQLTTIINTSAPAVAAALTTLYARQSAEEQNSGETHHLNGLGFNATDARFLSSLARQVGAGRRLNLRQLTAARRALPKYTGQLLASRVDWQQYATARGEELQEMEALAVDLSGGESPNHT